jgi:hypothetical protein
VDRNRVEVKPVHHVWIQWEWRRRRRILHKFFFIIIDDGRWCIPDIDKDDDCKRAADNCDRGDGCAGRHYEDGR